MNFDVGGIVDEDALLEALVEGKIGGAAIDVFRTEKAGTDFVAKLADQVPDKVLLTPHIGSTTPHAQKGGAKIVVDRMVEHIKQMNKQTA